MKAVLQRLILKNCLKGYLRWSSSRS